MKYRSIIILVAALALGGCAISTTPIGLPQDGFIVNDLKSAAYNLDQAIAIGVLPKDDPAAECVRAVLADLGVDGDGTDAQSFMPKRDGLISTGAVLYIRARQLERLKAARVNLPTDCKAVIGQIVIDAAKVAGKVARSLIPGGGLISIFR